ncbi:disulfide bond formation protein DsbA [Cellulomonas sp. Root485]|uniref:DsbA family oxidoreductase n=1 Tax=Cellulomonas sp. Root485 TaxID=1736546 RepID=UPI0006F216FC|nr:DsbA family oxidoreductase [Cellulomonas sp. Root485]KQY20511.1 disulfide bond formation protein DsbA [Cellulomonas sp. Root485]
MSVNALPAVPQVRTLNVEVWSDIACPWCYIGKRRFATALADFPHREHVEVTWRAYELSPSTPVGPGIPEIDALARHKGIPRDQVTRMFAQVTAVAAGEGLAYDFDRAIAANTFAAHRLVHLARTTGGPELAERVLEALFSAHFEHGADLGDDDTLVRIVSGAGVDAEAARATLDGDDGADAVRADEDEARALGVTGVPFFVVDRRIAVSGAQPADVFTQLLETSWRDANPVQVLATADGAACVDDSCAL